MTHYSDNPGMVRVDYFRPSGKWYMTEAHDMTGYYDTSDPYSAVEQALRDAGRWLPHFTIVVREPYHQYSYPVMIVAKETDR